MNSDTQDLEAELRKEIEGEVRFDAYSKVLYSTDASIYQIEPIGVVIPRSREDVVAAVRVAARRGVPILPRGGGTSLSGQTVGHAIHIDFSKYMNRVLELCVEEQWVRVQPGVVQDELNAFLRPHGFGFGPDTSSSNRATLGGMVGNNSAGSHSILYGKTIDHTLELNVALSDGSGARFGPVTPDRLEQLAKGEGLENLLYREARALGQAYRSDILARYPKIIRRVSGYNLDELAPAGAGTFGAGFATRPGAFNLSKVVVGSEGTLAVVEEAKVRIVPLPKHKALEVVLFHDLVEAVEATGEMTATSPAATELIDRMILERARQTPEFARQMSFVEGDPGALLVVEFFGDTETEAHSKVEELDARLKRKGIGFGHLPVTDPAQQQNIWKVRKDSLGLLMGTPGDRKPIAFVEDPAVPVERLPEFVRRFRKILAGHNTVGGYYGHASVGCLHIRPLIDLKQQAEAAKMRQIAEEVFQLVVECGGSMSGEHGDGLARSHFNERLFGPRVYEAFQKLKAAFDPHNILNPGKVVNAPEMTRDLRYGPGYQTIQIQTHLDFSREGGFARAVEMCNGAGICRKTLEGTMCPSFQATREEEHSTRGRANALRAALSGHLPAEELTTPRMYEVLDLCLECKGCKRECPSNVDLAKIKYEFLAHYYARHGVPLRARLFANIGTLSRWGGRMAPLANTLLNQPWFKQMAEWSLGIDARRSLPPLAEKSFQNWFRNRRNGGSAWRGKVILLDDCFLSYNYPQVGIAATKLLERAGFEVVLAKKDCCGRPMISKGLLKQARRAARRNVNELAPLVERGAVIVGCEPSCLLTLRDEYLDLLRGPEVKRVAEGSYLLEEFLCALQDSGRLELKFRSGKKKLLLHGHCHQKAHIGTASTLRALRFPPGYEVAEINSGCCGMAGSFGFEKEHYEISRAIAGLRLAPAVNAAAPDTEIVITGVSCRQQIEHFTGRKPRHAVEVLREALA
ncbi:MAG: FAD-binding protein [Acidobacteria bacterium]|nr:FAD-binding protein [Acidobacteriota bacterium]